MDDRNKTLAKLPRKNRWEEETDTGLLTLYDDDVEKEQEQKLLKVEAEEPREAVVEDAGGNRKKLERRLLTSYKVYRSCPCKPIETGTPVLSSS
ncbi:hypothetical protein SAY87_015435 [Trapa incisa]|uniref:Uncharacterized protein n=1 Tax=Trapa incisa TaxID=236973 RepID=A0AAN7GU89_9MYRT|nr:hypothetical protein SAY87_015435 [Trapa incisa]